MMRIVFHNISVDLFSYFAVQLYLSFNENYTFNDLKNNILKKNLNTHTLQAC